MYRIPQRHAQRHTNHKPVFAEMLYLVLKKEKERKRKAKGVEEDFSNEYKRILKVTRGGLRKLPTTLILLGDF